MNLLARFSYPQRNDRVESAPTMHPVCRSPLAAETVFPGRISEQNAVSPVRDGMLSIAIRRA